MTSAALNSPNGPQKKANVQLWLQLLQGWHALLALGCLAALFFVWNTGELALWLQILATVLMGATAILSGTAVVTMRRLKQNGRILSLALNYLIFLFCLFGSLHRLNAFTGIDSLANTFARGLPFLGLAVIGYFIGAAADRYENQPARQKSLRQARKWLTIIGLVGFLIAVGILTALLTFITSLTDWVLLAMLAGVGVTSVMLWAMWRRAMADHFRTTNAHAELLNGYLFLSPNLLGFLIFFAGPLFLSLYFSFTNSDAFGNSQWIGLDNYAEIFNLDLARLDNPIQRANEVLDTTRYSELNRFTILGQSYVIGAEDVLFWIALGNTLQFMLLAAPLSVIPALLLANLLNSKIPGMKFFRAVYFLPSVAAVVGIALVWQWLYNATIGYINYAITLSVNFLNTLGFVLADPQIRWLSESRTALLAVVIMAAWQWIGFNTVLFLAGLQNIPGELYEAATVDGASPRQQFFRVTLPLLAPTTFFVVTTTVIQAMQVFEQVFIIMPGQNPAGPGNSTLTMVLYLYQKGFQRFEQGYASAIAWVLFLLIFTATLFQFQRQRSAGGVN